MIFCNTLWCSSLIEESHHPTGVKHSLSLKSAEKSFYPVALITISDWKATRSLIFYIYADGKPCNNLKTPWTNPCLRFVLLLESPLTIWIMISNIKIFFYFTTHTVNAKMQCLHQLSAEEAAF